MKRFKKYLEERSLGSIAAAAAIGGAAMAAPPKPEATQYMVDYLKQKEGFRPVAEPDKDARGNPIVIGYGITHKDPKTGKPLQVGQKVTEKEAEEQLRTFMGKMTPHMEKIPGWDDMDAGKQAALLSFGYNFGPAFYGRKGFDTITAKLRDKDWEGVPDALALYNKGGGEVLGGLVKRREEEGKLWTQGLPGSETPQPEKPEPTSTQPTTPVHVVKSGDTLSAIAKSQGRKLEDVLKANPEIKDPNKIKPGQRIR